MALAVVHVVGALAASFALSMFWLWVGAWEQGRVQKRRLQDASITLGVPVASLENEEHVARLLQYSSQRFSGDLLKNRLSDLCGLVRTAWGYFGSLLQLGVIGLVAWQMYEGGSGNAVYMWSILGIAIFFWLSSVVFSFACFLLTGRYPGEAKGARKAIATFIEQRPARTAFDTTERPL